MLETPRVRQALAALGMEPQEAIVYEHLCGAGAHDAATIARGVGLTRAQVYRALDHLVRRAYAAIEPGEPDCYRPMDLTDHFALAGRAEERRVDELARARTAFAASVSAARAPRPSPAAGWKFRPVTGRHSFHVAARRLILNAHESVLVSYAPCASERDERGRALLLAVAERRRTEGIRLRVVTRAPAFSTATLGAQVPIFFVIDGRECLFFTSHAASFPSGSQGTWTNVGPLVTIAQLLHEELWQAAQP